ncbi:MAG TPA: hypothetical protein VN712_08430, partial [Dermatophilaceae bacterium]|nr:hypothetical protein [Dermatophilaceae bacterium]
MAITALLATTLVPGALAPASAVVSWTSTVTSPGLAKGFPESFDDGDVKLRLCTEGPQCMAIAGTPEYFWYGAAATGGNLKVYLAGI